MKLSGLQTTTRGTVPKTSHPSVIHLGVEAAPLVLQQAEVLLGLGGAEPGLLSATSQQHGLSLIQQAVVLLRSLSQLSLKLLHTVEDSSDSDNCVY